MDIQGASASNTAAPAAARSASERPQASTAEQPVNKLTQDSHEDEKKTDALPWQGLYPQRDTNPDSFFNQVAQPDSAVKPHGPQRAITLGQYMSANSEAGHTSDGADNLSLSVGKEAARTQAATRNNQHLDYIDRECTHFRN